MRQNIRKYYLYQFFLNLEFWVPILVIFWLSRGLNMTQVLLLQSIYGIAVTILELPTGSIADYFGKRQSLIFGSLFFGAALGVYGLGSTFWQFAVAEIIAAVGMAFVSGADRAFIHESLKLLDRGTEYRKVEGRARSFSHLARGLSRLAGGFIAAISMPFTLFFQPRL